jgi:hypothetical protein
MITNTGKAILSKYLIGQTPSYASHIAIGCGAVPLMEEDEFSDYSEYKSMDFEMFRVPILSRGYVTDEFGTTSVALSAELPTEQRYEITEVGIFPAGSNPSAGSRDSKTIFSITRDEGWQYHSQSGINKIPYINKDLDKNSKVLNNIEFFVDSSDSNAAARYYVSLVPNANTFQISATSGGASIATTSAGSGIHRIYNSSGDLIGTATISFATPAVVTANAHGLLVGQQVFFSTDGALPDGILSAEPTVFHANASNTVFESDARVARNERCRFLDNMVMIAGNEGDIDANLVENRLVSNHIHLAGVNLPFDRNSPTDEIKLALSVINKRSDSGNPSEVRIIMEFQSTESVSDDVQVASFKHKITADFSNTRYFVITKQLQELVDPTIDFSWSAIQIVRISVVVIDDNGDKSNKWYVAIDGVRLENVSTINPLYGLTGYSVVRTLDGLPVVKGSNTKSLVEFRFSVDVDGPIGVS